MPHLLIAGTTGSGKSGCINAILTSILLRATPDDVRMILIDPKRIELGYYEAIPHLLTPVVSNPKQASAALANCVAEMERRYERMSILRARNLPEANRQLRRRGGGPVPAPPPLPAQPPRPRTASAAAGGGEDSCPCPLAAMAGPAALLRAPRRAGENAIIRPPRSRAPSASTSSSRP